MRVVIVALLPLVLGASAVLAQSGPVPPKPAPAAKAARSDAITECMRLWDTATHMSKQEWSRTCDRIQTRLENLKVDNLGSMPKADAKKKRGG